MFDQFLHPGQHLSLDMDYTLHRYKNRDNRHVTSGIYDAVINNYINMPEVYHVKYYNVIVVNKNEFALWAYNLFLINIVD